MEPRIVPVDRSPFQLHAMPCFHSVVTNNGFRQEGELGEMDIECAKQGGSSPPRGRPPKSDID